MIMVLNNSCYAAMKRLHLSFYPDGDAAKSGIFDGVNIPGAPTTKSWQHPSAATENGWKTPNA